MAEVVLMFIVLIVGFLIFYAFAGVRIVRPYQRGVIEQLGKYQKTVDSGLNIIFPFVQKMRTVDMREQVIDVPPQEVITEDNVAVSVDAVIYYEPTDPQRLLYNISNFILAVTKLAQTNLRNVIGEMTLDEAFTSRERVNAGLRDILDDATDKWGVRVVRVEIQRIDPPQDVMHAMHEQMKAERTRRAVVTEAEGAKEAAVTRAEGEKASAVLTAEGLRERDILVAQGEAQAITTRAEAERYRQQVVAEGEADAIRNVYTAITTSGTDDRVIAIKYLESLAEIANGQATKIFVPAEMGATMGTIGGIAELIKGGDFPPASPTPPRKPAQKPMTQASKAAPAVDKPKRARAPKAVAPPTPEAPPAPPASSAQWRSNPKGLPPTNG